MILVKRLGHHAEQVRAGIVLAEEVGLDVNIRIEAQPRVGRFDANPLGDEAFVVRQQDLAAAAFVNDDVGGLHADRNQVVRDLRHHLRHRHRAGRAGAVDLDADEILRVEESRPAVARIFVAGQRGHAAGDHFLNGRDVDFFGGLIDALGGVHRDDASGIGSGHPAPGHGLVFGYDAVLGDRPRVQRREGGNGGRGSQKGSPVHISGDYIKPQGLSLEAKHVVLDGGAGDSPALARPHPATSKREVKGG